VILLIVILSSGLTPLAFRIMQAVDGSDTRTETQTAPANPSAEPPPIHPAKTNRPEFPNAGAYVRHELESIIIPVVDFKGATVEEAIDFLRQRSRELSSEPPEIKPPIANTIPLTPPPPDPDDPFTGIMDPPAPDPFAPQP
jgi:hypothetical protein